MENINCVVSSLFSHFPFTGDFQFYSWFRRKLQVEQRWNLGGLILNSITEFLEWILIALQWRREKEIGLMNCSHFIALIPYLPKILGQWSLFVNEWMKDACAPFGACTLIFVGIYSARYKHEFLRIASAWFVALLGLVIDTDWLFFQSAGSGTVFNNCPMQVLLLLYWFHSMFVEHSEFDFWNLNESLQGLSLWF